MGLPEQVRKGYHDNADNTHTWIADAPSWGVTAATLHGRTRQQRCALSPQGLPMFRLLGAVSLVPAIWVQRCSWSAPERCGPSSPHVRCLVRLQASSPPARQAHALNLSTCIARWAAGTPGGADWDYIGSCVAAAPGLQLIGNGDIMSHTDYAARMAACPELATVMLAGAAPSSSPGSSPRCAAAQQHDLLSEVLASSRSIEQALCCHGT